MESTDEVVARGFGGAVGAVGLVLEVLGEKFLTIGQMVLTAGSLGGEGWLDALGVRHLESAVDLVGGDVVETLALELLRQALPVEFGGLEEAEGAHHVGLREGEGVLDGAVHMALGGKVDDAVDVLVLHQLVDTVEVADVHTDELIVGLVLDVLEIGQVAGVGQLVEVDDAVLRILVDKQAYHMASDKSGSAGDDDIHGVRFCFRLSIFRENVKQPFLLCYNRIFF